MNELDEILLHQLHVSMRNRKHLRRIEKLLKNDPVVKKGKAYIEGRIKFFESMIEDKTLLHKKIKRNKKEKENDLLARNPIYEWYRNAYLISKISYSAMYDFFQAYMSNFKKDRK